jgi:CPA1 family monovalent cation:H+ antiporter
MTVGGIALGWVPFFPNISLDPELVLLLILPPMVYSAAVDLPWEDFRGNATPISMYAVALVAVTSGTVAFVAKAMIGTLSWPEAFALGAIVSPTDPVASTSVSQRLGLPRRLQSITEGEGLVNDAVALTILKLATAAIVTHAFSPGSVVTRFLAIVVGETLWGLAVGWLTAKLRRRVTDPQIDVSLSLATPFLAYIVPESLGGSGVLATVAAGMYIGIQAPELLSAEARVNLAGTWNTVTFLLEGSLFFLTGLQFRYLLAEHRNIPVLTALLYGAAITATAIVLRFLWTWGISELFASLFRGAKKPPRNHLIYLGWCGMRGGISLAAALSLPTSVQSRHLILFLTACAIAGTLILQGAPLPWLVRRLRLDEEAAKERNESGDSERWARIEGISAALQKIESCGEEADRIRNEYSRRQRVLKEGNAEETDASATGFKSGWAQISLDALHAERNKVVELHRRGEIAEQVLHRIERDLDLRELRLKAIRDEL